MRMQVPFPQFWFYLLLAVFPVVKPQVTSHKPTLCDPTVQQYSGYITVPSGSSVSYYFYWFYESRNDPANDPLTVWLNGGPGCSSMLGLWNEVGPCRTDGSTATYNERGSWNKVSNILFIDQPTNTGFSYAGQDQYSTTGSGAPFYQAIQRFLKYYPKYQKNPFRLFGESYAGHYVPYFAYYIFYQNKNLPSGNVPVNLVSIGIGNGITDYLQQIQYMEPMACNSSYGSVLSAADCKKMRDNTPTCLSMISKCRSTGANADCVSATSWCMTNVQMIYKNSKRSIYDIRTSSDPPENYVTYLNKPEVQKAIGATPMTFQACSSGVNSRFSQTGDFSRNFAPSVAYLLNNGVKALIYAGDADYYCNWMSNLAWTDQLNYPLSNNYSSRPLLPWNVDGKEVGQFKQGGNLTFVRIYAAGHDSAYFQPEVSLSMFNTTIHDLAF
ncbi:peptidase S10, serine carboxypeptidase [Hesseltinella vesiculosa]|uniref:Carboxypeptidase n=1 Tax=Hesseltinella vesiculosa TaxID=101127 RepID=A0A1X2GI31_9FUNG|nr:peptidase S10, serine carboxypeptidase [Hesseltinella vesiculosa]